MGKGRREVRTFLRDGVKEIGWMLAAMALAAVFGSIIVIWYQGSLPFSSSGQWLTCLCQDETGRQVELSIMYPTFPAGPVKIRLPDGTALELPMTKAPRGARYSDGTYSFWDKVHSATLEKDGRTIFRDCTILE